MRPFARPFSVIAFLVTVSTVASAETPLQAAASFVANPTYCNQLLGKPGYDDGLPKNYGQATATVLERILDAEPKFSIADSVAFIREQCSNKLANAADAASMTVGKAGSQ